MLASLLSFCDAIDFPKVRLSRPSKFVFFCGGTIPTHPQPKVVESVRDYLLRVKQLERRLQGRVVLAEAATQLYRDSGYRDLISFEEDIAKIASLVVVIAESPGSLAELGAFSSSTTIRPRLRILLRDDHARAESFVRYGPIERIKKDNRSYLGVYPWRNFANGCLIQQSVKPHSTEIMSFLSRHLDNAPRSELYENAPDLVDFIIIYWLVYLFHVVSPTVLYDTLQRVRPHLTQARIRNLIYCMRLVGWMEELSYSGQDYLCVTGNEDPIVYRFKPGVADSDSVRRKMEVTQALASIERAPRHVRRIAAERRGQRL